MIFAFLCPLIGLILSISANNDIKEGKASGGGIAMAGIVISIIFLVLGVLSRVAAG